MDASPLAADVSQLAADANPLGADASPLAADASPRAVNTSPPTVANKSEIDLHAVNIFLSVDHSNTLILRYAIESSM